MNALSDNQQAMLDLALGCDLKVSEPVLHEQIRTRHKGIKTQAAAARYIGEVEEKIHGKRKFRPVKLESVKATLGARAPAPVEMPQQSASGWGWMLALLLLVIMVVFGLATPAGVNFILVLAVMIALTIVLGLAITKQAFGVLVSDRNLMSLSRFQMTAWAIVVLAAYFTFAMMRIKATKEGVPVSEALNIVVDWHLWALLGISTTSLVGAPLILGTKTDKDPDPKEMTKAANMTGEAESEISANRKGTLYANGSPKDARLSDMLQGDELTNTAKIDLAKLQMFYFTVIALVCFCALVIKQLTAANPDLSSLPVLPDGLVAILGISHAGYLGSKGIDHTKVQN